MRDLRGQTAVLTGANGGLGMPMARALAAEGMNLLLVAYPGIGLDVIRDEVKRASPRVNLLVADLRQVSECERVVAFATQEFGGVDVLVNNAGLEHSAIYHELPEQEVRDVLAVNLEAPMLLARRVLPGMVERRHGHIINISSLAGKGGPACQEPYVATKAALTAFTFALRATYHGTGVSASVVCPGFVEAGIYARLKARTGRPAPALLSGIAPESVARAVVRAIRNDVPEIIVNRFPIRPALALAVLFPRWGAWLTEQMGINAFFRSAVEREKAARK